VDEHCNIICIKRNSQYITCWAELSEKLGLLCLLEQ
jgi:hypothetical protein